MKRLHGGTRTRRGPGPSLVRDCSRSRVKLAVRVEGPNKLLSMTAFGARRKHVTLPTDFRSPSVNGHSCYGHLTARFAPKPTSTKGNQNRLTQTIANLR